MIARAAGRIAAGVAALAVAVALVAAGLAYREGDRAAAGFALRAALAWAVLGSAALGLARLARARPREVALALASALAAALLFDLVARWIELPAGLPHMSNMGLPSRRLHHAYPPDQVIRLGRVDGQLLTLRTNEDGLRSAWSREAFRRQPHRVAVLGDSFVFGLGVQAEQAMPQRLERRLRQSLGPGVAVLNAGVVSYSPLLARWLHHDVVSRYAPQLVIYLFDASDVSDDLRYSAEADFERGRPVFSRFADEVGSFRSYGPIWELTRPVRRLLAHPFEAARKRLGGGGPRRYEYYGLTLRIGGVTETNGFFIYRHPLEQTRPHFERSLAWLRALAREVQAAGARFVLVVAPRYQHWNPAECPDNWEADQYALDEPYQYEYFRFFDEARERVDFPIHDLLPAFRQTDAFPLVFSGDPHWNARGNDFVAERLARAIESGGWLEPPTAPLAGGARAF